jgi:hypothetical protein
MKQDRPLCKSSCSCQISGSKLSKQAYLFGLELSILNYDNFTEKLIFLDEASILFIVLSYH